MQWSDDSHRFDVRLRGTVTFTDDLTDVQSLSDGGYLTLRDWSTVVPHTVEITSSNGALTRSYFVAGLKRPWDDEAKRFLATQLPIMVRQSGIGAESRVKSIFERRGVNGVFEEIDRLGGDYARRLYLVALIDVARFDAASVQPLLQRVGDRMKSDYDRRQVLEHVASTVTLDRKAAAAYVQAMATMRSDYDQREALSALTKRQWSGGRWRHPGARAGAHEIELRQAHGARTDDRARRAQHGREENRSRRRRGSVGTVRPAASPDGLHRSLRRRAGAARTVLRRHPLDLVELRPPRGVDGSREERAPRVLECRTPCSTRSRT